MTMALPNHPPPPYVNGGSPLGSLHGTGQTEHVYPPSIYNHHHRPMPPPSPQQFHPRYHAAPPTPMPMQMHLSHTNPVYEPRAPLVYPPLPARVPQKRPGSSMSISSMLDSNHHERAQHEVQHHLHHHHHYPPRPGSVNTSVSMGALMSPPYQSTRAGFDYAYKPRSRTPDRFDSFAGLRQRSASSGTAMGPVRSLNDYQDRYAIPPVSHSASFQSHHPVSREDPEDGMRRPSLGAILRPSSQPQTVMAPPQSHHSMSMAEDHERNQRAAWYADPPHPSRDAHRSEVFQHKYDIKPPAFSPRPAFSTQSTPFSANPFNTTPDQRRSLNGHSRLATILNETTASTPTSQYMLAQNSTQSQSDPPITRIRHFSPHLQDDRPRKSSDEIQQRIFGIGTDARRGRTPVPAPQPVQGPQARTPVPDGGIKSEQGRVFSGIGGGISSHAGTPTPAPPIASPFKRDIVPVKAPRNSTAAKRRKAQEDASFEAGYPEKKARTSTGNNKRSKQQNNYKADLEEMEMPVSRKLYTTADSIGSRRHDTPASVSMTNNTARAHPIKQRKTVDVRKIVNETLKKPRKHLGNFSYKPDVLVPQDDDETGPIVQPNLLPRFAQVDQVNCTYTIHVSRAWLEDYAKQRIGASRSLWGTGVYADDSDPVAAAIHMGWLEPSYPADIDKSLVKKVFASNTTDAELPKQLQAPMKPLDTKGRDIRITMMILPLLQHYPGSALNGIVSRDWPARLQESVDPSFRAASHDGVSFAIIKVEIAEANGRAGRKERLRAELIARAESRKREAARVARMVEEHERLAQADGNKVEPLQEKSSNKSSGHITKVRNQDLKKSTPSPLSKEVSMLDEAVNHNQKENEGREDKEKDEGASDTSRENTLAKNIENQRANIVQDGEEWIRQLATAAA